MRALLVLLSLLVASPAFAWDFDYVKKKAATVGGAEACGDASGLIFEWHMENTTVTSGSPAGCSSGDTTATLDGSAALDATITPQDGSAALYMASGGRNSNFTLTNQDIVNHGSGTAILYFRYSTWLVSQKIFLAYFTSYNNAIILTTYQTNQLALTYTGNATSVAVYSTPTLSANTWYKVTIRWRTGVTDPALSLQIDANTADTSNTDLTAMTANSGTLYIGSLDAGTYVAAEDNIKIYNAWK